MVSVTGQNGGLAPGVVTDDKIEQAKPIQSVEDIAVTKQLRDLIENKLQRHVPWEQDRAGVETFYRKCDFVPLWVSAGKPLPRAGRSAGFSPLRTRPA